jgi:uncharacterized protein (TIGR02231 family)
METILESAVKKVTVYPDQARVTVGGALSLPAGVHRILVGDLPVTLDRDSVRVAGAGEARVRLLGVDVRPVELERAPAVRVRELEEQIERLGDDVQELADGEASLAAQAKYLEGLRQATEHYARGLATGRITVEVQSQVTTFIQEQDTQTRAALRELGRRKRDLTRQLDRLKRELAALSSGRAPRRLQAAVDLEVLSEGRFEPEITYAVRNAHWSPLYDVRLLEDQADPRLEVTVLAQISQQTGQEWSGVQLQVSTARPALTMRLPELTPWYVDQRTPRPPMIDQAAGPQAKARMAAATLGEAAPAPVAEAYQAEQAYAEAEVSEAAVTYAVAGQADIPSDGSPHKVTLRRMELRPRLDYLTVPRLNTAVFRRVKSQNDAVEPLLPGALSLFAGDEYIGSGQIGYIPAGGDLELLLGAEERIKVERELARREVDKVTLRDRRQLVYGYKITVHNFLARNVELELQDHYPVSRDEQIRVRLERVSPEPAEQSDLHIMKWKLGLAAGAEQTVYFEFSVEHPRSLQVSGLLD